MPDLLTPEAFAQSIKAKYPDYASVPDAELAAKMLEKYPEYRDRVQVPVPMNQARVNGQDVAVEPGIASKALGVAGDVATGFAKGAGQTAFYAGKMMRAIPGVGTVLNEAAKAVGPAGTDPAAAFKQAPDEVQPHGIAQHVGNFIETLAEMAATGKVSPGIASELTKAVSPYLAKAAAIVPRAVEGARGAAQAAMHGENPIIGGVLGAVLPGSASAVGQETAASLRSSAEKNITQALGPTKERFKAIAERRAGEMLDRGVPGALGASRDGLLTTARANVSALGKQIGAVIGANADKTIPTTPILDAINAAKSEFQHVVQGADGPEAVAFVPRAVKQLDGLKDIISQYGDTLRVDQAVAIRRAWDKIVADAGGFAHRSGSAFGVALKDASEAATKRTATSAIRTMLDDAVPDLAALDKEYGFWRDVQNVTAATLKRTQAQGPGLGTRVLGAAGAAAGGALGFHAGGIEGGMVGAFASKELAELAQKAFTSPRWAFIKASAKNDLATAITDGSAQKVGVALGRILAFEGAAGATAVAQR